MSGWRVFFRELVRETLAGSVETNRCGVLGAVERHGELRVRESLPRGEAEDLLVVPAQLFQRGDDFRQVGTLGTGRSRELAQPRPERREPSQRAPLVREHARRDRIEPREPQFVRGRVGEAAPRDRERIGDDVLRVRVARTDDTPPAADPKAKAKPDANAKKGDKDKASTVPAETPKAIDLLYFVDSNGLFAAAGYDPKDSLRALTKAPTGSNLRSAGPMASALSAVGSDASFVVVADALRIVAMTTGSTVPTLPQPLVIAAGRTTSPVELWGRVDLPSLVLQQLIMDYARKRTSP